MEASIEPGAILVLNGPNLNLLGEREPELYGSTTIGELEGLCSAVTGPAGVGLDFRQTNHEGVLIDWVQEGRHVARGIVLNAGGYTHTSVALRDAVAACSVPVVEVHISDIHAREEFRRHSYLTDVTAHQVIGQGVEGYAEAIRWILDQPPESSVEGARAD
jgi:3-dehydroquinate dehydratase-2